MPIPLEFSLRSGKGLNAEENHQNKEFHGDIFIFTTTYDPEGEGGNQMRTGALVATPPYTDVYLRVLACVSRLSGLCSLKMGMSGLTKMPNKTERIHLISQSLNSKILCNTRKKRNFTKSRI